MPGSNLNVNWEDVAFDGVTLIRVNTMSWDKGGSLLTYKGDGNMFDVAAVVVAQKPKATIATSNPGQLMAFTPGQHGVLTATNKDAEGLSGGDIIYEAADAVFENPAHQAGHAAFGTVSGSWQLLSSDGITPAFTMSRA